MKIRCRLLTLKIWLYSIFSMENDLCPNWTSNFLKNNHKSSDYRTDYLRQMRYLHVDSFFSKI